MMLRQRCKSLKARDLKIVQDELRESPDFKQMVESLVDVPRAKSSPLSDVAQVVSRAKALFVSF